MSRSRKKHPHWHSDGPTHIKWAKREANKKVRRTENIPSGMAYRKLYCTWDIRDLVCVYWTRRDWEDWCKDDEIYRYYMK